MVCVGIRRPDGSRSTGSGGLNCLEPAPEWLGKSDDGASTLSVVRDPHMGLVGISKMDRQKTWAEAGTT